jgi:3-hydroxyisobutyrate dehydrogenase
MIMSKPRIAFLGLGLMGSGMARRLLVNGFPLTVFNRNAEKSKPFAAEGAQVADSPREAAAQADIIISMVSDDNASRGLWLGATGALAAAKPGAVCLESSTVTVNWACELSAAAKARGCEFLDAPVTGSKMHAANGELIYLIGGEAATLEKARPALASMSKAIYHVGPSGSGALLKLINNFLCGVQVASFAEALGMIERAGLARAQALEILTGGAPGSPIVKTVAARMTAPDFTPHFPLRWMTKDLGYAMQEGAKLTVHLMTAMAALNDFQNAISAGLGEKDMAAVVEPFRKS